MSIITADRNRIKHKLKDHAVAGSMADVELQAQLDENNQEFETTTGILRLLQLFCEGHQTEMQNLMRDSGSASAASNENFSILAQTVEVFAVLATETHDDLSAPGQHVVNLFLQVFLSDDQLPSALLDNSTRCGWCCEVCSR